MKPIWLKKKKWYENVILPCSTTNHLWMSKRRENDVEPMWLCSFSLTIAGWSWRGIVTFIYIWRQSSNKHLAGISLHTLPVEVRETVGGTQTGQSLVTWLVLSKGPFVLHGEQGRMTWWTKGFGLLVLTFWTTIALKISLEDETQRGMKHRQPKQEAWSFGFDDTVWKRQTLLGGEGRVLCPN